MSNIRETYKIQKTSVQESYERQLVLKLDKEYEANVNKAYIIIVNYFKTLYPNVNIEPPRAREKSPKSLLGKIKNLEIERLSKLFVLGEIKDEEKVELFALLKERVNEHPELENNVLEGIRDLLYKNIESIDINKFIEEVIQTNLSASTKTALLRILKYKVEESNLDNKEIILQELENQYGEKKQQITGKPEDNLLRNESIEELKQNEEKRRMLYDVQGFLKAKDLRGMKLVIDNIPDDFETNNQVLKELLAKRKQTTNLAQRKRYDNECISELSKEFVDRISKDEEILNQMNAEVIKDSKKHKSKTNGYIADHIKFHIKGKKEQTFELQVKSAYVEEIAMGNGSASHAKRPGKRRVLPNIANNVNFIKELMHILPKYTLIIQKDGKYTTRNCSLLENTMSFFQDKLTPNTKEYAEIENMIKKYESVREAHA